MVRIMLNKIQGGKYDKEIQYAHLYCAHCITGHKL